MNQINIGGYNLFYEVKNAQVSIVDCEGRGSIINVPESIDVAGEVLIVTDIGKKAFLGLKSVREIVLPDTIETVGDWAFSRCAHLKKITIPGLYNKKNGNKINFGRRVFEGCQELYSIGSHLEDESDLSYLCGALVSRLPAEYLLWDDDIGSESWFERWDLALCGYVATPDHEGYSDKDNALCGEEDISYDGIGSVDGEMLGESYEYIKKISKNKCGLCLLRCVHSEYMTDKSKELYDNYINEHKLGVGNCAAWFYLKEDEDRLDFYEAYLQITNTNLEELSGLIADLDEDMAEKKAFLISKRQSLCEDDFFDSLLL